MVDRFVPTEDGDCMTKRSENKKIDELERHWDLILRDWNHWWKGYWNVWLPKAWNEIKIAMDKIINWIWFSKEKSKGEKAFHIIIWLLVARAFIRLWYNV